MNSIPYDDILYCFPFFKQHYYYSVFLYNSIIIRGSSNMFTAILFNKFLKFIGNVRANHARLNFYPLRVTIDKNKKILFLIFTKINVDSLKGTLWVSLLV